MVSDEHLDDMLAKVPETFRVPPEPPLDQMWHAIDAELTATPSRWQVTRRTTPWNIVGIAAAAALVLGVGVGRWSAPGDGEPVPVATVAQNDAAPVRTVSDLSAPVQRATSNYFGETEALLRDVQRQTVDTAYAQQATVLLARTRVLLDSPEFTGTRMHDLLEDLELILAQIAMTRGQNSDAHKAEELKMIRSALAQRDVVPRLRTAVVTLASLED